MLLDENEFRDYLFDNYKENISDLIIGRRNSKVWMKDEFPPISFLLQEITEQKINKLIDALKFLIITAKELKLKKTGDSTTRVDLFGNSEDMGITIIELKKSKQTERQSFTELLAYANHFCTLFPGLKENSITTVLIAPMQTRTVRDAYVQELLVNNKNTVALVPAQENDKITLTVYYPDESYYQWFENNLLDDRSMITVALAFPLIEGCIDSDINDKNREIPDYSREALNTISSAISYRLESEGYHALVFASQKWGEIAQLFPYPNLIFIAAINPFSSFRSNNSQGIIYGESGQKRISDIQYIYNQLSETDRESWLESIEGSFHNNLITTVRQEFELCFKNREKTAVAIEISLPDWSGFKSNCVDAVFTHNLDLYLTGLLRLIYITYIRYMYEKEQYGIFFSDDFPKYSYDTFRNFLAAWEILSSLGFVHEIE